MTAILTCGSPACDRHDRLLPGQHRFARDPHRLFPLGKSPDSTPRPAPTIVGAVPDVDRLRSENKELAESAYCVVLKSRTLRVENTTLHRYLHSALAVEPNYQQGGADLKAENASVRAQLATARNERAEANARASMGRMAW
jgi:hypothetical protein